jgi:hypothetical protein
MHLIHDGEKMKRLSVLLSGVSCVLALSACQALHSSFDAMRGASPEAPAPVKTKPLAANVVLDANGMPIERVPFRPGVSSFTVERLARQAQCTSSIGAGLVTEAGPVEVYRIACDDGKVFMARCELRQCKPM